MSPADRMWPRAALVFLKDLCGRALILYVFCAGTLFLFADRTEGWKHVVICALSRYMPDHDYLKGFNLDRKRFDAKKMAEFERYYLKVARFMPLLPEAHAMAGFCLFYDGKIPESRRAYEQAMRVYSKVFNFHYNLALIALKENDPAKALKYFKSSVTVNPVRNVEYVLNARVYKPFFPAMRQPRDVSGAMGVYTRDVYGRAYQQILVLCEQTGDFEDMLSYARQGMQGGFIEKGTGHYYAGRAAYELRRYRESLGYFEEAIREQAGYSQVFYFMGMSLKALGRPESVPALTTAAGLSQKGKNFPVPEPGGDLLVY